jgi:hypothetical protein
MIGANEINTNVNYQPAKNPITNPAITLEIIIRNAEIFSLIAVYTLIISLAILVDNVFGLI